MHSDKLVSPDQINARVLILNMCNSLLLQDTPHVDVRWGLTPALLGATLGSVIATWDSPFVDTENTRDLVNSLVAGETVGRACARLNGSRKARNLRFRMALLGDPRVRLPVQIRRTIASPPVRPKRDNLATAGDLARLSAMRCSLDAMIVYLEGDRWVLARNAASSALECIGAFERAAWGGRAVEGDPDAPGPQLRAALLEVFTRNLNTLDMWAPLSHEVRVGPSLRCPVCRIATLATVTRFAVPALASRHVCRCPLHSMVRDAPLGRDVTGALDGDVFVLRGRLPTTRWAARLVLESKLSADNVAFAWPVGAQGRPAKKFPVPRPWPAGPVYAGVAIAFGTEFLVVGQNAPG